MLPFDQHQETRIQYPSLSPCAVSLACSVKYFAEIERSEFNWGACILSASSIQYSATRTPHPATR
jgi:hypothetical protein